MQTPITKILENGTYIIESASKDLPDGDQIILGVYTDKGKMVYLLSNYTVSSEAPKIGTGVNKFNIVLKKNFKPIEIVLDGDVGNPRRMELEAFIMALKRHDHCCNPENDNFKGSKQIAFTIKNKAHKVSSEASQIKAMGAVFNYINQLTTEQLRDLEFSEGGNALGKTHDDLFVKWAHFEKSPAMIDPKAFLARQNRADKSMEIIVNKAVTLQVISKKEGYYYIGTELIGRTIEDIINYCKENTEKYEKHIVPAVRTQDTEASTPAIEEAIAQNPNLVQDQSDEMLERMKQECRDKGIPYQKTDTYATLQAAIGHYESQPTDSEWRKECAVRAAEYKIGSEKKARREAIASLKALKVEYNEKESTEVLVEKAKKANDEESERQRQLSLDAIAKAAF